MCPTGRRPDHTPRLETSPACCLQAIFAGAILHTYTEKYILYLHIDAEVPVAREKQWATMLQHVIMRVVSTSGQALKRYKENAFSCELSYTFLDMFGKLGLEDRQATP